MDLKSLYTVEAHESGSEVQIISPVTGKKTDFFITVMGPDSKQFREAVKTFHRALLEDNEAGESDMLVAVTKGWKGLKDGKTPVEFSPAVAKELYVNSPFVAAQLDRYIADRKNFTRG